MLLFKRCLLFYLITYYFPSLLSDDKGALAKSKHKKRYNRYSCKVNIAILLAARRKDLANF